MNYEVVIQPKIKVRAWCKDGVCCVEATIPTMYGDLKLCGSYPLAHAARMIHAKMAQHGIKVQGVETGGFFSKLKKMARKVAQAKALAPIIRSVKQIQKNPVLARAVGLTTAVVPGLGSAKIAVEKAAHLVQQAGKGNFKALADLRKLKSLALMGLPQARDAWRLAQMAHRKISLKTPVNFFKGLAPQAMQAVQQAAQLAPLAAPFFPPAAFVAPALQAAQQFAPYAQQFAPYAQQFAPFARFAGAVDDEVWQGC